MKGGRKQKGVILYKPSGTIAIAGDINASQRKLYNIFLYVAQKTLKKDKDKEIFETSFAEIKKLYNLKRINDYDWLTETIESIMPIYVHYNITGKDKGIKKDKYFTLLSEVDIEKQNSMINVRFSLPPIIRQLLKKIAIGQGQYADIDIRTIVSMRKKHTITLYEIVKDYLGTGQVLLEIMEFRRLLGVENKYKKIPDLRKWVIEPAIKEINENPLLEIAIKYELIKTGRRYTHIKLLINKKKQELKLEQQAEMLKIQDTTLYLLKCMPEKVKKSKKIASLIEAALEKYTKEYIKAQIEYINAIANKKNINNYYGYLKKAIDQDFAAYEMIPVDESKSNILEITEKWVGFKFDAAERGILEVTGVEKGKNNEYIINFKSNKGENLYKAFDDLGILQDWLENQKNFQV